MAALTLEQIQARQAEIRERLAELDTEFAGERMSEEGRAEWNSLNEEREELDGLADEIEARNALIESLRERPQNQEAEHFERPKGRGARRGDSRVPENLYDIAAYRANTRSEDEHRRALRDGAMKVVEMAEFAHPDANREDNQTHIGRMLDTIDHDGTFARRVIETSSPTYFRAWSKKMADRVLTTEEERALAIGTQGGGYPVPIALDPSVILTSNGQVNPLRQISRVVQITGNTWNGVLSTGMSAGYAAELTEMSDNSPTLTQGTANVEKAQAFVPYSIEEEEDWGGLGAELAIMLQDAKDSLEATKFLSGAGHGSNEPQGLHNGATAVVSTAATAVFAVADLYSVVNALAERWQPGASIVANRAVMNKIRQFDTSGGASLWVQLQAGIPQRLLDYPTYMYSTMSTGVTSSNATILTIGDFSRGFYIIDRVGMNTEVIPHLLATANNRPYGARGLVAYWRNTALVTTQLAFKSVKVL